MNQLKINNTQCSLFLILFLCLFSNLSQAAPNLWSDTFEQGWVYFIISNERNDTVNITCNAGVSEEWDNRLTITLANGKEYTPENVAIEFVINEEVYGIVPETITRTNGGLWDMFIGAISKATTFDVYINNKKVGTFNPSPKNVQKVLKDMGCSSLFANSLNTM